MKTPMPTPWLTAPCAAWKAWRHAAQRDDAARYHAAAEKLRAAYFDAFYNPATGVLAGWRSADGQLHDYNFLFVNGIAIHYGLVPKDKANAIMDRLLAKMKAVGYTRFDLGLPGNLISVARKDYATRSRVSAADAARTTRTASRSTKTAGPPPASPTSRWPPCMTWAAAKRPTACSCRCCKHSKRAGSKERA